MTIQEAGLALRRHWPELEKFNLSDEKLATLVLNKYPRLYDLISPFARQIKEVAEQPFESGRWFESGRLESTETFERIRKAKIENLHLADMTMEATKLRVPVAALQEMAVDSHKAHLQMQLNVQAYELEKRRDNDALDAGNRQLLTPHELIDDLEAKLMTLVDRADLETHPKKKRILNLRIKRLMEELDGRATTTALQASHGERVESRIPNSDIEGNSGAQAPPGVESVPSEKSRIGF